MPHRFATVLPPSPLSYDGQIVKVCWCVRVRLFMPHAPEAVAEIPFQLGNVAIAVELAPGESEVDSDVNSRVAEFARIPIAIDFNLKSCDFSYGRDGAHIRRVATIRSPRVGRGPARSRFALAMGQTHHRSSPSLRLRIGGARSSAHTAVAKSTLLESLKPAIIAAGRRVLAITLRDGQRRLPREFLDAIIAQRVERDLLVVIDGYEQLGWFERRRIARRCRRAGAGLLVTAHAPTRLPTLILLAPNEQLIEQLVADLCGEVSTPITTEEVAASHACHGSNVREIFFDLYDRYERKRRSARTGAAAATY